MPNPTQTEFIGNTLPTVSNGEGCYVFDTSGTLYLNSSRGLDLFSLRHAHPEVNDTIKQQLDKIANR